MAKLLRIAELRERVGLSVSTIYRRMSEGTFPPAVRVGPNAVAWRESEIDAWIDSLPESGTGASDAAA